MDRKKDEFYDDGRTVADMSGVERQRVFLPRLPKKENKNNDGAWEGRAESDAEKLSREDRHAYVFGALGASLLVAGIFILAAFLFICFFLFVYNR